MKQNFNMSKVLPIDKIILLEYTNTSIVLETSSAVHTAKGRMIQILFIRIGINLLFIYLNRLVDLGIFLNA